MIYLEHLEIESERLFFIVLDDWYPPFLNIQFNLKFENLCSDNIICSDNIMNILYIKLVFFRLKL